MKIFLDMLLAAGVLGGLGLAFGAVAMLSGYLIKLKNEAEGAAQK